MIRNFPWLDYVLQLYHYGLRQSFEKYNHVLSAILDSNNLDCCLGKLTLPFRRWSTMASLKWGRSSIYLRNFSFQSIYLWFDPSELTLLSLYQWLRSNYDTTSFLPTPSSLSLFFSLDLSVVDPSIIISQCHNSVGCRMFVALVGKHRKIHSFSL